jgi:integrase
MAAEKLTVLKVQKANGKGLLNDGNGLYLAIGESGSKSWVLRFKLNGQPHAMGLGSLDLVPLAEARERAREARRLARLEGVNPIEHRLAQRRVQRPEIIKGPSLRECAERYVEAHCVKWKHTSIERQKWKKTFFTNDAYIPTTIADLPIEAIDEKIVLTVLGPLREKSHQIYMLVRGRIERVLDWAVANKLRKGGTLNPARWEGHLEHLLPISIKHEHFAALPYGEIGPLMAELRQRQKSEEGRTRKGAIDIGAVRALEFTILTAVRPSEALKAEWDEIDLVNKLWTIPKERMKTRKEHRVPLVGRTVDILRERAPTSGINQRIFTNVAGGQFNHVAYMRALRALGYKNITVHGFRSCFRDWCGDRTHFERDVVEAALAHKIANQVEAAYRRSDALEKRRQLMLAWDEYCATPTPTVGGDAVPIGRTHG